MSCFSVFCWNFLLLGIIFWTGKFIKIIKAIYYEHYFLLILFIHKESLIFYELTKFLWLNSEKYGMLSQVVSTVTLLCSALKVALLQWNLALALFWFCEERFPVKNSSVSQASQLFQKLCALSSDPNRVPSTVSTFGFITISNVKIKNISIWDLRRAGSASCLPPVSSPSVGNSSVCAAK